MEYDLKRLVIIGVLFTTVGFLITISYPTASVSQHRNQPVELATDSKEIDIPLVLREHDYRVFSSQSYHLSVQISEYSSSGEVVSNETQRYRLSTNESGRYAIFSVNRSGRTTEQFFNIEKGIVYQKRDARTGVEYNQQNLSTEFPAFTGRDYISGRLPTFEYEFVGTVGEYNGTYLYNITGFKSGTSSYNGSVTGEIYISETNVVRELHFRIEKTDGGVVEQRFILHNRGETSVEKPEWISKAKD